MIFPGQGRTVMTIGRVVEIRPDYSLSLRCNTATLQHCNTATLPRRAPRSKTKQAEMRVQKKKQIAL
jgi:2,3-bisphosphoglycerate-independent phosphoglycerate mutase